MKSLRFFLLLFLTGTCFGRAQGDLLERTRTALESRLRAEEEMSQGDVPGAIEARRQEANFWDALGEGSAWRAREARQQARELELTQALGLRGRGAAKGSLGTAREMRKDMRSGRWEKVIQEGEAALARISPHLPEDHSVRMELELALALANAVVTLEDANKRSLRLVSSEWSAAEDALHAYSLFSYAPVASSLRRARKTLQSRILGDEGGSAREQALDRIFMLYVLHLSGDFTTLSGALDTFSEALGEELGKWPGLQFELNSDGEERVNLKTIYERSQRKVKDRDVGFVKLHTAHLADIAADHRAGSPTEARALSAAGSAALLGGKYLEATSHFQRALGLRRNLSTDRSAWVPFELMQLAICVQMLGDAETAGKGFDLASKLYQDLLLAEGRAGAFDELPTDLAIRLLQGAEPSDLRYRDARIDGWLKQVPTTVELKALLDEQLATGKKRRQKRSARAHKPSMLETMRLVRDLKREEERAEAEARGETVSDPTSKAPTERAKPNSAGALAMARVFPILARARRHRATGEYVQALGAYEELQPALAIVRTKAESATHEVDACEIQLERAIVMDLLGRTAAAEELLRANLETVAAVEVGRRRVASKISYHSDSSVVFVDRESRARLVLLLERAGRTAEADALRRQQGSVAKPGPGTAAAAADLLGLEGNMGGLVKGLLAAKKEFLSRTFSAKRTFLDGQYGECIAHIGVALRSRAAKDVREELRALRAEAYLLSGDIGRAKSWRAEQTKLRVERNAPKRGPMGLPARRPANKPIGSPFVTACELLEARITHAEGQTKVATKILTELVGRLERGQQSDSKVAIEYQRVLIAVHTELARMAAVPAEAMTSARVAVALAEGLRASSPILTWWTVIDENPKTEAERLRLRLMRQAGGDPQDMIRQMQGGVKDLAVGLQGGRDLLMEEEMRLIAAPHRELAEYLLARGDAAGQSEALQLLGDVREIFVGSTGSEAFGVDATLAAVLAEDPARREDSLALARDLIDQLDGERRGVLGDEIDEARWHSERLSTGDPYQIAADAVLADVIRMTETLAEGTARTVAVLDLVERGRGLAYLRLMGKSSKDLGDVALARMAASGDERVFAEYRGAEKDVKTANTAIARVDEGIARALDERQIESLGKQRVALLKGRSRALAKQQLIAEPFLRNPARSTLNFEDSRGHLRDGELLLYYMVGVNRSWLTYSLGGADPRVVALRWSDGRQVGQRDLKRGTDSLIGGIAKGLHLDTAGDGSPDARQLAYALLPRAVRKLMVGATRVLIVPDGPLHGLPFEVLPVGDGDKDMDALWLHSYPAVISGPSLSALLLARTDPAPVAPFRQDVFAIGNPTFHKAPAKPRTVPEAEAGRRWVELLERLGSFSPLPYSGVEAEAVVRLVKARRPDGTFAILSGAEATLAGLDRALDRPRFLHFSTHGVSLGAPFVRDSCLALAGAGGDAGEGLLSLGTILDGWSGRLDSTELAVLSGCRTAAGTIESGSGAIALSWGFLFAGARSVLATRWNQDGSAAPLFMARFYDNFLGIRGEPMPKADALLDAKRWIATIDRRAAREASRKYFNGDDVTRSLDQIDDPLYWEEELYGDPRIWAAYVLTGDMD